MTQDTRTEVALELLQIPSLLHRSIRRTLASAEAMNPDFQMDITPQQFGVLMHLDKEGVHQVAELGKKLQIAKAQMTQVMDKLSERELIDRAINPSDRRAMNISLTANGKTVLETNKKKHLDAMREAMSPLSDHDLNELSQALQKVRGIMKLIDKL